MKALLIGIGKRQPSTRFRIFPLKKILERRGYAVEVIQSIAYRSELSEPIMVWVAKAVARAIYIVIKTRLANYDVIIIQRHLIHRIHLIDVFLPDNTIVDIDDAVYLDTILSPAFYFHFLRGKTRVVAGNHYIADAILSNCIVPVSIIPTVVDTDVYCPALASSASLSDLPKTSGGIKVGWIGSPRNLAYVHQILDGLSEAMNTNKCLELTICTSIDDASLLDIMHFRDRIDRVSFIEWSEQIEVQFLNSIDIGIMPLGKTEWDKSKCGFKLLQYMACGLPSIATAVGVNNDILQHRFNGMLASSPYDWAKCLNELSTNSGLRNFLGRNARNTVLEKYSQVTLESLWGAVIEDL